MATKTVTIATCDACLAETTEPFRKRLAKMIPIDVAESSEYLVASEWTISDDLCASCIRKAIVGMIVVLQSKLLALTP